MVKARKNEISFAKRTSLVTFRRQTAIPRGEVNMSLKRLTVFLVVMLFASALVACELSASTPPPTTLTSEGPMSTLQSELEQIATQTAAAGGAVELPTQAPPAEATATPEAAPVEPGAAEPTAEPEAGAEATAVPPAEPTAVPPTEAPPVVVATATPGLPTSYTLQSGEHPYCIARRFNVNQTELLNLNGLSLNSQPAAGTVLKIPQTGNPFVSERALRTHPTTYSVSAGETIYSIACKFGDVSPEAIAQANNLSAPYDLSGVTQLNIP
jgi:LysM repeat protein